MKERRNKKLETLIYGGLSLLFTAAFFFGVLYPDYGVSDAAYKVKKNPRCMMYQTQTDVSQLLRSRYDKEFTQLRSMYENDEIRYTSYVYECLINS